ncbi:unnamed protein product [Ixodes persulcatus]
MRYHVDAVHRSPYLHQGRTDHLDRRLLTQSALFRGGGSRRPSRSALARQCHQEPHAVRPRPRLRACQVHLRCAKFNPYDCCVSFFNHFKHFPVYRFEDGTFEEFFELFMRGEVDFGSYFCHLLSWYGHRDEPNVLFMTYEDLKQDTRFWIQNIADLLGSSYGESLRHSPEAMEQIVEETGVADVRRLVQMEKNYQRKVLTDTPRELLPRWAVLYLDVAGDMLKRPLGGDFVRKGVVGDWRNYFTAEQTERMKRKVQDECQGTDIMQLWKHLDIC